MPPRNRYAPMEPPPDDMAPILDWDRFSEELIWLQDEHVGLVGPTGQGKTNATYHLLEQRRFVTYFSIKPNDRTLDAFGDRGGYVRIDDWPPMIKRLGRKAREATPEEMPRRLLWPDATRLDAEERKRISGHGGGRHEDGALAVALTEGKLPAPYERHPDKRFCLRTPVLKVGVGEATHL